jgi:predicted helicase
MTAPGPLKPTHKAIKAYREALDAYAGAQVDHEGATETAFQRLLGDTARATHGWMLVPKLTVKRGGKSVIPDGTVRDAYFFHRGYWEAKDTDDDLAVEIKKKIAKGYPLVNTIFEDTTRAVLYQNGVDVFTADLTDHQQVCDLLNAFFSHTEPVHDEFEEAVDDFKERVPELAQALAQIIKEAHATLPKFEAAFDKFFTLCQAALNPNIRRDAVDEMLIQHLLTERLIRTIFDKDDFTRQNVIAAEVETVIAALTSQSFSRKEFLKKLDRFYLAIEHAAASLEDFGEKQHFLNTVYERFFQGYSVKVADTHGIIYTPQAIVDFICSSIETLLREEFGKSLSDAEVQILDPCTGTGNFIVNLIKRLSKKDLPRVYAKQLYANEVMLLPYYVAALNIEHAYFEKTGQYEPFNGLCFVDTLDLVEKKQKTMAFLNEENTQRVEKQRKAPITVIIGNPPYNVGQQDENDNNKNRKYDYVDSRLAQTYVADSTATLRRQAYDPYIRFFRWATDRLREEIGIICFVSNNGFLEGKSFDGFRKHLMRDFQAIYHLDLKGNAHTTGERRRREAGNVFSDQIRVGIGITILIRNRSKAKSRLSYWAVDDYLSAEEKQLALDSFGDCSAVPWQPLSPDSQNNWLSAENSLEFEQFIPLATKEARLNRSGIPETLFKVFSCGIKTGRDDVVYDFCRNTLAVRVAQFIDDYNAELDRFRRQHSVKDIDSFLRYDKINWSRNLKRALTSGREMDLDETAMRSGTYRPFVRKHLYFSRLAVDEVGQFPKFFPSPESEEQNRILWIKTGPNWPPLSLISSGIVDLLPQGGSQCLPFFVYDEDGTNRRENITDWALNEFCKQYKSKKITKWDIFYYVYGLLHHPGYRTKYADNLKRELPRIPFAPDFAAFSQAGEKLAKLHLDYQKLKEWPLKWVETEDVPLSYRVETKMKLERDKSALHVNDSLTLADIPPETFEYRLGNRSALEWVIDQYQVSTDKRSGIVSDPNRADDPEYIVRLVGQVVRVSVETVKIVNALPAQFEPK